MSLRKREGEGGDLAEPWKQGSTAWASGRVPILASTTDPGADAVRPEYMAAWKPHRFLWQIFSVQMMDAKFC